MTDENKTKNKDLSESNLLSLSYGSIIRKDINLALGCCQLHLMLIKSLILGM